MSLATGCRCALRCLAVVALVLAAGRSDLVGIPYPGLKRYGTYILTLWLVTAVAAMGVNLIVGYAGQETLAQAAFLGIGAYTTALLTKAGMPFGARLPGLGALAPSWSARARLPGAARAEALSRLRDAGLRGVRLARPSATRNG